MLRALWCALFGLLLIYSIPGCGGGDKPKTSKPPTKIQPLKMEAPAPAPEPPPPG